MGTVATVEIPIEEFALSETFAVLPEVQFEAERVVTHDNERVMPVIWVSGGSHEAITDAIDGDTAVENADLLVDLDDEWLYEMRWIDGIQFLIHALVDEGAMILEARGRNGHWRLRLLFPDRDALAATREFCEREGLSLEIIAITQMEGEPSGRHGLTEAQYEALVTAQQEGYFEVPRRTTTEELAEKLGVSHQALSERLRRGHDVLVQDTLAIGADPPR